MPDTVLSFDTQHLSQSSHLPYETGPIFISHLQMRTWGMEQYSSQDHTANKISETQKCNSGHFTGSYYIYCQLGIWSVRSFPLNIWRAAKQRRMRTVLCGFKGTETTLHICIIHSHNSHVLSSKQPQVAAIETGIYDSEKRIALPNPQGSEVTWANFKPNSLLNVLGLVHYAQLPIVLVQPNLTLPML